jgi:hypothetical protein|tara:strand:+ start:1406 stop:2017 length:612 start_codon:yes stop_codon:yes gene_type:complete
MKIIELILDEENLDDDNGITAVSIVSEPAIAESFIALKNQEFKFAEQDKEKRLILGAALVPNRPIYRRSEKDGSEFYIFFSKSTVRKASELFFIKGNQSEATLEHDKTLKNMTIVESWIVESEKDKTRHYGMDVPVGSWVISMKVNDDDVWNNQIKNGKVSGFSIEAFMVDRFAKKNDSKLKKEVEAENLIQKVSKILKETNV